MRILRRLSLKTIMCKMISKTKFYGSLNLPIAITFYTLCYMSWSMFVVGTAGFGPNFGLFIIFLIGTFTTIYVQLSKRCIKKSLMFNIFTSIILSGAIGIVWALIVSTLNPENLYGGELISNNAVCKRPSKATFVCKPRSLSGQSSIITM